MAVRVQDINHPRRPQNLDGVIITAHGVAIPPSKSRPRWTKGDASWVDRMLATSRNEFIVACCLEWRRRYGRSE